MRNWRVVTAITAVVLAALAAVLAYQYLAEADERAQGDVELVPVLRARSEIPRGTEAQAAEAAEMFEVVEIPRKSRPDTAVTSAETLAGMIAAAKIPRGQFVTAETFVAPGRLEGFSSTVAEGKQAIAVSVDETRGVAGFVAPNDTVNVIVTAEIEDITAAPGSEAPALTTTAFLIPGVKVLAVGSTTATTPPPDNGDGNAEQPRTGLFTLEVTPRQALQLAHVSSGQGQVYLTLNAPGFDTEEFALPPEIVEAANLFDQPLSALTAVRDEARAARG